MKEKKNRSQRSLQIQPEETKVKVIRPSPIPFYAAAACWVAYALLLPLYRLTDFFIVTCISLAGYFSFRKIFPGKTEMIEEPVQVEETGDKTMDTVIQEGREYLRQIREVNDGIPDPELSKKIYRLEDVTRKIFDHILQNPKKVPQIRKFMGYYLPTTLKLLKAYETLDKQGVKGENILSSMHDVEMMMDTIIAAFEKQLDNLFQEEALDISSDISVLETMLAQEGLSAGGFSEQTSQK